MKIINWISYYTSINFFFGRKLIRIEGIIPINSIINPGMKNKSWKLDGIKNPANIKEIPVWIIDFEFNLKKYLIPFFIFEFLINLNIEENNDIM